MNVYACNVPFVFTCNPEPKRGDEKQARVALMGARLFFFNAAGTIIGSLLSMIGVLGHGCNDIYGT